LRWFSLSGREPTSGFGSAIATAQIVRRCLLRLRASEAEALLLYEWAGLSCAEIAALTGEQASAVRMRICRARARFCDYYEQVVANDVYRILLYRRMGAGCICEATIRLVEAAMQ
jgi:sigma-70-like protein